MVKLINTRSATQTGAHFPNANNAAPDFISWPMLNIQSSPPHAQVFYISTSQPAASAGENERTRLLISVEASYLYFQNSHINHIELKWF